jgi:hypothetical protein
LSCDLVERSFGSRWAAAYRNSADLIRRSVYEGTAPTRWVDDPVLARLLHFPGRGCTLAAGKLLASPLRRYAGRYRRRMVASDGEGRI